MLPSYILGGLKVTITQNMMMLRLCSLTFSKTNNAYDLPHPPSGKLIECLFGTKILRKNEKKNEDS